MKDTAIPLIKDNSSNDSLACFDGQKTNLIKPFREFLEAHGLTVLENTSTAPVCTYQVVIGSSNEVKDIFSRVHRDAYRRLILLVEDTIPTATSLAVLFNAKVAVIDNGLIGQDQPRVIFGFLCDDGSTVIDLSRHIPEENVVIVNDKNIIKDEKISVDTSLTKPLMHPIKTIEKNPIFPIKDDYWKVDEERIEQTLKAVYEKKTVKKSNHFFQKSARFFLLSIVLIFVSHIGSFGLSIGFFAGAYSQKQNPVLASRMVQIAEVFIAYTDYSFKPVSVFFSNSYTRSYEQLISITKRSEQISMDMIQLEKQITPSLLFSTDNTTSLYTQLSTLKINSESIQTNLSLLRADIAVLQTNTSFLPQSIKNDLESFKVKISSFSTLLETIHKLSTVYPLLAPPGEKKSYLVLFQNSTELRPTGGFIGSTALASINNGTIHTINIEDVYTYDGQLRGHVDPPLPIRTLLQQEHWYLRDSNWDPDFEVSAAKASWFYEKSGGTSTDGVVGLTLPFIQNLLDATGPIHITEISEAITKDNFAQIMHDQTETNFFPGSTQKKDLLGSIFRTLLEAVTQGHVDPLKLASAVTAGLEQKNIQIFSSDKDTLSLLHAYKWSGALFTPEDCHTFTQTPCLNDFLFTAEANVGVNKANAKVTRSLNKQIQISGSTISGTDSLIIQNNSSSADAGGGEYTYYTRFYYPSSVSISSVEINHTVVPLSEPSMDRKQLPYAELLYENPDYTVVGIASTVASNAKDVITITEKQTAASDLQGYVFSVRPQAGTNALPFTIKGNSPVSLRSKLVFPVQNEEKGRESIAVSDNFEYTTTTDRDTSVGFSFIKP